MALQAFSVDRVTDQRSAQVMNPVNKWPLENPRKRKIILLLAGIEPGSPSCESDVLPLDHGLPCSDNCLKFITTGIHKEKAKERKRKRKKEKSQRQRERNSE